MMWHFHFHGYSVILCGSESKAFALASLVAHQKYKRCFECLCLSGILDHFESSVTLICEMIPFLFENMTFACYVKTINDDRWK